ncbi:MAG: 16S rRNA (guanine(966)-N(2))-methyltransferase RsmD [Oscillospiraceae bacterium]|nr:16S rRNA (guanine(966)-N(2))-methyltransferase RsmD [Oscillospiraceae bacterium]
MRVISGTVRGKRLKEPSDYSIRPTTDMVKEALFNIIQFDIEGRRVLDLFAGTGQLGIECLSRGAASVTFVDLSKESVAIVKQNLKTCGFEARVVQTDSIGFLSRADKYDIILLDPPYATNLLDKALEIINSVDILSEGGIIVCESGREKSMPDMNLPYFKRKEYNYGKVKLTTYGKETDI